MVSGHPSDERHRLEKRSLGRRARRCKNAMPSLQQPRQPERAQRAIARARSAKLAQAKSRACIERRRPSSQRRTRRLRDARRRDRGVSARASRRSKDAAAPRPPTRCAPTAVARRRRRMRGSLGQIRDIDEPLPAMRVAMLAQVVAQPHARELAHACRRPIRRSDSFGASRDLRAARRARSWRCLRGARCLRAQVVQICRRRAPPARSPGERHENALPADATEIRATLSPASHPAQIADAVDDARGGRARLLAAEIEREGAAEVGIGAEQAKGDGADADERQERRSSRPGAPT